MQESTSSLFLFYSFVVVVVVLHYYLYPLDGVPLSRSPQGVLTSGLDRLVHSVRQVCVLFICFYEPFLLKCSLWLYFPNSSEDCGFIIQVQSLCVSV